MRILGVDPGLAATGTVVIEAGHRPSIVHKQMIRTSPGKPGPQRLAAIVKGIAGIIKKFTPSVLAIETAFVRRDAPQAGLSLGKVLGVILLTAYQKKMDIVEITPREAKETLTGYGNASKEQVQRAVTRKLALAEFLKPSHVADAAAVALTAASILATLGKKRMNR